MLRIILFFVLACGTASAWAAPPIGTRIDPAPKAPTGQFRETQADAIRLMNSYSRCVADARPATAEKLLRLPLLSEEQNKAVRRAVGGVDDCMGYFFGELTISSPVFLLAGMAEELYLSRNGKADVVSLVTAGAGVAPRNLAEDMALCLVRRNPAASRALIGTDLGSEDEAQSIRNLVPDLGPCTPSGTTLKLDKYAVRTYAAIGLYLASQGAGKQLAASAPD
jgi:hypothetical protein